jgi:hypothetical protein
LSTIDPAPAGRGWLERLSPLGALIFAVWLLIGFFTSDDYDDTPEAVIAYAESDETNIIAMQILALAMPLLIGWFLYGLLSRFAFVDTALRSLTAIGGALFIAFVTTGFTLWNGPLLDDDLDEFGAETYLALDDAGWILLGAGGVSIGVMILAVSIAAIRERSVPTWVGIVSLLLGVLSFATVAAVGLFAWLLWLIGAALLMLFGRGADRTRST